MSQLDVLIERAASIAGSEYKVAKELAMAQSIISAWKAGTRPCSPTDRAALAAIAGMNAAEEAIEGLIETINADTEKGQRAKAALEEALKAMKERPVKIGRF